jgi:hypothetical protein
MTCTTEPNTATTRNENGQGSPKRTAAEFWELYVRHVAGEFGGDRKDPSNAWERGALRLDGLLPGQRVPDRFDLPPDVAEAFQRAADLYEHYVNAVEDLDSLDPRWTRWHALREALPGVRNDLLRRLLDALDGVGTETLAAMCAVVQPSEAVA